MSRLPVKLLKEPLIDAVFEVRLGGNPHLADILPGFLFGEFESKPVIQRLPAHEIPGPVRQVDPNLTFEPLIRLDYENFTISVGERNIIVGCKIPYPKWPNFRSYILDVMSRIVKLGIRERIERYSLKYINIIEANSVSDQIRKLDISIKLGNVIVDDNNISLVIHTSELDVLHILTVVTSAQVSLRDSSKRAGVIVDVDSIRNVEFDNFADFHSSLVSDMESLRNFNKIKFFECLSVDALREMEPVYD